MLLDALSALGKLARRRANVTLTRPRSEVDFVQGFIIHLLAVWFEGSMQLI